MKSLLGSLVILGFTFFGTTSFARGNACEQHRAMVGNTQITTAEYPDEDICWVSVHPSTSFESMVYRDFMFGNDGLFFVFNSYGDGPSSSTTGAREYYVFPRLQYPYFDDNQEENTVIVTMANQEAITFDGEKTRVTKMSGATFTEANDIAKNNKGGFELSLTRGVLLDCGFTMGNSPSANPSTTCKFSDNKKNICTVKASQLFDYLDTGDNKLKFNSDKDLANFLKKKCSNIDTSDLEI